MKCNDAQEMMMKFFDNELNDFEYHTLKKHIKYCSECIDEFDLFSEITHYFEAQPLLDPNEGFVDFVLEKVEINSKEAKLKNNRSWKLLSISFAILFSLIFIIASWALIFFDSITLFKLASSTLGSGFSPEFALEISNFIRDRFEMALLIGNSVMDIYNILFRNFFHVLISFISLLIIVSSSRFGLVRQHR